MKRLFPIGLFITALTTTASAGAPPKATPQMLEKGKTQFNTTCAPCHGEKGDGTGAAAATLNPKPRNFATDTFKNGNKPEQIFQTISDGLAGTAMASFGYLSEDDRWALAHYVVQLQGGGKGGKKEKGAKKEKAKEKEKDGEKAK